MIGNDIVDLSLAAMESDWRRIGFLNKVFTEFEKQYIHNSENSFLQVWLLWSMKESAYKAYVQKYSQRFFNPKKIRCYLEKGQWRVVINKEYFNISSEITTDYVHSIAMSNVNQSYISNCFITGVDYKEQHIRSYEELIKEVSATNDIPTNVLRINKDMTGIPRLYRNNLVFDKSFSISHHGKYGSYSILN